MEDEASRAGTSSNQVTGESPELTIEINIKTLEPKIYTLRVSKNMPVPALMEKLVDVAGVPVERQRLIFRGKVLKYDHLLSEYHLEDGHTPHLVARQPVEGQLSSGTGSEGAAHDSSNQGNDSTAGAPRYRSAQVSHNVLFGTANVAHQGENIVADVGQLVGAVLISSFSSRLRLCDNCTALRLRCKDLETQLDKKKKEIDEREKLMQVKYFLLGFVVGILLSIFFVIIFKLLNLFVRGM